MQKFLELEALKSIHSTLSMKKTEDTSEYRTGFDAIVWDMLMNGSNMNGITVDRAEIYREEIEDFLTFGLRNPNSCLAKFVQSDYGFQTVLIELFPSHPYILKIQEDNFNEHGITTLEELKELFEQSFYGTRTF